MTNLEFWLVVSALWVALAWLPYILDRLAVRGLMGALANPSPDAIPQSDWAVRAKAAHKVLIEAFAAFAPLAVLASIKIPEDPLPGTLAMIFFWGMLAHYVVYASGVVVLRTLVFAAAVAATAVLALRLLGVL